MLALNSLSCLLYQCFNRSLAYVFDLPLMCACMCVRACVCSARGRVTGSIRGTLMANWSWWFQRLERSEAFEIEWSSGGQGTKVQRAAKVAITSGYLNQGRPAFGLGPRRSGAHRRASGGASTGHWPSSHSISTISRQKLQRKSLVHPPRSTGLAASINGSKASSLYHPTFPHNHPRALLHSRAPTQPHLPATARPPLPAP